MIPLEQTEPDIVIPLEVQEIFDQADMESEYAAVIDNQHVRLTSKDGKIVYKEVLWKDAYRFSKNAIKILTRTTQL